MKLPYGDRLKVEQIEDKLINYVLNPEHSDGKHKARLFKARLGINLNNRKILVDTLMHMGKTSTDFQDKNSPYGKKYVLDFELATQEGFSKIRSVWMIRSDADYPSLITAYPI